MASVADNEKISELRSSLTPETNEILEDWRALKFISARQGDVEQAAVLIQAWATWWQAPLTEGITVTPRQMSQYVALEDDPNEDIYTELCPHSFQGYDHEGRHVFWEKLGQIAANLSQLLDRVTEDEVYVRHVRINERNSHKIMQAAARLGAPVGKMVGVLDLSGLPYFPTAAGMRIMRRHIACDEAYYCEGLHKLVVINAPFYFTAIWTIVKPWLDPVTLAKISIVGSSYVDALKEVIPEEHIPVEYGGLKEDFSWSYPDNYR